MAVNKAHSATRSRLDYRFRIQRWELLTGDFSIGLFTDIVAISGHQAAVEEPLRD